MGLKVHHGKKHDGGLSNPTVLCSYCGVERRTTTYRSRNQTRHFCNQECRSEWMSEQPNGGWQKLGRQTTVHTCETCDEVYFRDISHCQDSRWCSMKCQMQGLADEYNLGGQGHWNWRGGTSLYHAIRANLQKRGWGSIADDIRELKDHTCEWCGDNGGQQNRALSVHHIVPVLAGGVNHPDNLMVLCDKCHRRMEITTHCILDIILADENFGEKSHGEQNRPN